MNATSATSSSPWTRGSQKALLRLALSRPARRLGRAFLVGVGVMLLAFALIRLIPGDPAYILLGDQATPEAVARLRETLGTNGTLPEQLAAYVGRLSHGDLGTSMATGQSVTSIVARALPVTLSLIAMTLVMASILALPLGVAAAMYRRAWFGQVFRVGASLLIGMPVFFSGLVLILLLSMRLGLAPVAGYAWGVPETLRYLWLPALTICTTLVPVLARVLQSSVVDTMEQEFVESAIVRGLPGRVLIWRYLLRPSLAPTIGLLAYIVGSLLGSAVLVEMMFGLPGIGTALVEAVAVRDYTAVQGILLVFGLIIVVVGYAADTLSSVLDPRTATR